MQRHNEGLTDALSTWCHQTPSCLKNLKIHRKCADLASMRAYRRRQFGVTLIEVMTALACLALVSVSLVGGLTFASERLRMAEERGLVASRLRQVMEDLRANPNRSFPLNVSTNLTESIPGVSSDVQVETRLASVTAKPGLQELWCKATWNARIGESLRPQTVEFQSFVLRDPPIPKLTANLLVRSTNSFLHLNDALDPKPVILDLLAYGFTEGSQIDVRTVGTYTTGTNATSSALITVFSRTNLVLGRDQALLSRVPDAIDHGTDFNTGSTGAGVDIGQDFLIGASATRITIPAGARYIIFGVHDSLADNTGSIQVEVSPV